MKDTSRMFAFKLIWSIVSNSGSLWVHWTRHYLLRYFSLWDEPKGSRGSWIWKKLLKLRPLAADFVRHAIKNGESTFFWLDNWLNTG
ncbi:unnamed protein product [Arabis nemorensis]|uniref:Reverse transcriptase zinc-binding domain-containing protein n=1 Tax=Arabis nemorensis TaxID=586526 RepID=A0A565CSJ7_9BRAS|nr:unnamed protein product [Arabis nemorensis]